MVKAFKVKYKIKINEPFEHTDYNYQKLFRAIYGYTQVVKKSNGKRYVYHRPGVLSYYPYIKKGKNEVIVTKEGFSKLIEFLRTGKNPTHRWVEKGNWNGSYTVYDVDVDKQQVEKAVERQIKNTYVMLPDGKYTNIIDVLENINNGKIYDIVFLKMYYKIIKQIQNSEWYNIAITNPFVEKFDKLVKKLKQFL